MWKSIQPVVPVLLTVILMEGALGILSPLIGFRLASTGASTFVVGAAASAYFVGFLLGTLTCQRMIRRVGHIRAFGVFAVCASNAAILFTVLDDFTFWILLRGFAGYALAGAFVVIESWMTDKASEENRGRVFSMYTTASWAASGVSPLLLNFDEPGGSLLFVLVTIGLSAAMIPLAVTKVGNPKIDEHQHLPLSRLFRASPTGVVCAFGSGMMNAGLYGLFPAYIKDHGFGEKELSLLYSITTVAALVTQYPIGFVSDRFGRRPIIIGIMPMPPVISVLPKVKRGKPAGLPSPTQATSRPSISVMSPLSGRSEVMNTAQVRPSSTSQKYSKELKLSANSASAGEATMSTAVPKSPPTAENTSPAPSASSASPFRVSAKASSV